MAYTPRILVQSLANNYNSVNVTTGAWVQLSASLTSNCRGIKCFDSSGQTMELGYGPSGSEQRARIIQPGGDEQVDPLLLNKGMRISVRAVSATASSGRLDVELYY